MVPVELEPEVVTCVSVVVSLTFRVVPGELPVVAPGRPSPLIEEPELPVAMARARSPPSAEAEAVNLRLGLSSL